MTAIEKTRNVLIAVDVQNDFISGSLAVKDGEQVVEPINRLAESVRRNLGTVAFTRDWHPHVTPHFAEYGGIWPAHCVADSDGAAFHPDLDIHDGDVILSKGMGQTDGYSGMEGMADDGATLESLLQPKRHEKIRAFIGGLATDYCVLRTAVDAAERYRNSDNVELFAVIETMRGVNLNSGDDLAAITDMAEAGVTMITLDQALGLIDEGRIE